MQLERSVEEKEYLVISQALIVSADVAGAHGRTGRHGDVICGYHVEAPGEKMPRGGDIVPLPYTMVARIETKKGMVSLFVLLGRSP